MLATKLCVLFTLSCNLFRTIDGSDYKGDSSMDIQDISVDFDYSTSSGDSAVCETSLHTKDDLKIMIDFITSSAHIFDNVTARFYEDAINMIDAQKDDLMHFETWFLERPEHLSNNLEELNYMRLALEPIIAEILETVRNYPLLLDEFNEKASSANKLFETFSKNNQICELSCGKSIPDVASGRRQLTDRVPYNPKEYYCGSVRDIYWTIENDLKHYADELQTEMAAAVITNKNHIVQKLQKLKNELKEFVSNIFGTVMFDILNLHDEYYLLAQNMKGLELKDLVMKLKKDISQIYSELAVLENAVGKFAKYCRSCHLEDDDLFLKIGETDYQETVFDLLHNTILDKKNEIKNEMLNNYKNISMPLEELIAEASNTDRYVNDLKQLKEVVAKATEKQISIFNDFRNNVPVTSINKLVTLECDAKTLLKDVTETTEKINNFLRKD